MNLRTMPAELTDVQIEDFIQSWHSQNIYESPKRERLQKRLRQAIAEYEAVRELAKTPLPLMMLARFNRYEELPRNRERLYSKCVGFFLDDWNFEDFLIGGDSHVAIDRDDREEILQLIAAEMQANAGSLGGNLIRESRLQEIIKSCLEKRGVKKAHQTAALITGQIRVKDGILFYVGEGFYSFVHQRFLDYLLSAFLVHKFNKTREIDREFLKTYVFSRNGKYCWCDALLLAEISIYEPFSESLVEEFKADVLGKYCRV
jgi:predicted NACHT family NTPase